MRAKSGRAPYFSLMPFSMSQRSAPACQALTTRSRKIVMCVSSLYSAISKRANGSAPKKYDANKTQNSVLPTPVGPTQRKPSLGKPDCVRFCSERSRCAKNAPSACKQAAYRLKSKYNQAWILLLHDAERVALLALLVDERQIEPQSVDVEHDGAGFVQRDDHRGVIQRHGF